MLQKVLVSIFSFYLILLFGLYLISTGKQSFLKYSLSSYYHLSFGRSPSSPKRSQCPRLFLGISVAYAGWPAAGPRELAVMRGEWQAAQVSAPVIFLGELVSAAVVILISSSSL